MNKSTPINEAEKTIIDKIRASAPNKKEIHAKLKADPTLKDRAIKVCRLLLAGLNN
jgi:hypothetical protein